MSQPLFYISSSLSIPVFSYHAELLTQHTLTVDRELLLNINFE